MTCLKVSSSIQPTSAPTGTCDDKEGKDKADALATTNLARTGNWRRSAQSVEKTRPIRRVWNVYDISAAELHAKGNRNSHSGTLLNPRAKDKVTARSPKQMLAERTRGTHCRTHSAAWLFASTESA